MTRARGRVTTPRNARPVSMRTIIRRGRQAEQQRIEKQADARRHDGPETLGQARTWDRKCRRYILAGLCPKCAAQAAYGHADGFQKIHDPCAMCQPIVAAFPVPGPKGSKWRKVFDKLEYMNEEALGAWIDAH